MRCCARHKRPTPSAPERCSSIAKDDNAKAFYEHFTFETSPSDPYHLLLIMKDLLRIIAG